MRLSKCLAPTRTLFEVYTVGGGGDGLGGGGGEGLGGGGGFGSASAAGLPDKTQHCEFCSGVTPVVFFSQQPLLEMPKPVQPLQASHECAQKAYVPWPAMLYWP